jgi:hypothetical protein
VIISQKKGFNMAVKKYPIKKIKVDIEVLGGVIELSELTTKHKDLCNDNPEYDTPKNGLINAGLTEEQFDLLGEGVARELMNDVIDLTYPNMRQKLNELIEKGEYTPPSDEEIEESKKN